MTESEWLASSDPQAMLTFLMNGPATPEGYLRKNWQRPSDRKLQLWLEAVSSRAGRPIDDPDAGTQQSLRLPERWATAKHACVTFGEKANLLRDIVGNPWRPATLPKGPAQRCKRCEGDGWVPTPDGLYASRETCKVCGGKGTLPLFGPCQWLTPTILAIAQAAYEERPGRKCKCGDGFVGRLADDDEYACARCGRPAGLYGHYSERSKQMECPKCPTCHGTGRIEDGSLDPVTLAILADAMEDAGCREEEDCYCERAEAIVPKGAGGQMIMHRCHECKNTGRKPSPILSHLRSPGPHVRGCWALDLILSKE